MNVEMVTYPAAWPPGRAYPAPVAPSVLNLTMVMGVKRVFLMVAEVERTVLRSIIAMGIGVVYKLVFGWVLSSSCDDLRSLLNQTLVVNGNVEMEEAKQVVKWQCRKL